MRGEAYWLKERPTPPLKTISNLILDVSILFKKESVTLKGKA
jgi:hypothetical protein